MTDRQKRIRDLREQVEHLEPILRARKTELAMLEEVEASAPSEPSEDA